MSPSILPMNSFPTASWSFIRKGFILHVKNTMPVFEANLNTESWLCSSTSIPHRPAKLSQVPFRIGTGELLWADALLEKDLYKGPLCFLTALRFVSQRHGITPLQADASR